MRRWLFRLPVEDAKARRLSPMHVLLIDGLNLIRRIYEAVNRSSDLQAPDDTLGQVEDAIASSVGRALKQHAPTHALCVLESKALTWRHLRYPDYKKNRSPMPEALASRIHRIESRLTHAGVHCLRLHGFEADDVIATMAVKIAGGRRETAKATILSTDTKFCQILGSGIEVFNHFDSRSLDDAFCAKRFGVRSTQLNDWFALVGDSSLNLPGVAGVGPKTATRLIGDYDTLDNIYRHLDALSPGLSDKLRRHQAEARLTKALAALRLDVDVGVNLRDYRLAANRV